MRILLHDHGTLVTITRQHGNITVLSWEYRKNTTKVCELVPLRYWTIPMIIMFGMRHFHNFVGIFRFGTNSVYFYGFETIFEFLYVPLPYIICTLINSFMRIFQTLESCVWLNFAGSLVLSCIVRRFLIGLLKKLSENLGVEKGLGPLENLSKWPITCFAREKKLPLAL